MPVWRLQTIWQRDTAFPRDSMVITPHFDDGGVGTDPDGLCEDLADALAGWDSGSAQLTVRAYDAQGTPPVYPQGEAVRNAGLYPATAGIRQAAVCLSFYAGVNRPRNRGRLYIPAGVGAIATTSARVSLTDRTKVGNLATIFADLGGADVDWCVYSRLDDEARPVTNWWVDDVWDIQRSRALQASTRLEGTTSEA